MSKRSTPRRSTPGGEGSRSTWPMSPASWPSGARPSRRRASRRKTRRKKAMPVPTRREDRAGGGGGRDGGRRPASGGGGGGAAYSWGDMDGGEEPGCESGVVPPL